MPIFGQWQSKPPPGTQLNWSAPLAQQTLVSLPLNEGSGLPIEVAANSTLTPYGALAWTSTPDGWGLANNGTNKYLIVPCTLAKYTPFTIIARVVASTVSGTGCVWSYAYGSFVFGLYQWAGSNWQIYSSYYSSHVGSGAVVAGQLVTLIVTYDGNATFSIYQNGVNTGTSSLNSQELGGGTGLSLFQDYANSFFLNGAITYCTALARVLSPSEVSQVSANPWPAFAYSAFDWLLHSPYPSAGSGVVTLGALGISGSGTFTARASGSIALGSLAAAGAGRFGTPGSGTITLGTLAVACAGSLGTPSCGAVTLGTLAVACAGSLGTPSTGAVSLGSLTSAAAGGLDTLASGGGLTRQSHISRGWRPRHTEHGGGLTRRNHRSGRGHAWNIGRGGNLTR